jgi:hypothetical protein
MKRDKLCSLYMKIGLPLSQFLGWNNGCLFEELLLNFGWTLLCKLSILEQTMVTFTILAID